MSDANHCRNETSTREKNSRAIPEEVLDIYMIAIGGTGMAPLACLLARLGHRVRGADLQLYPPMSEVLAAAGIVPEVGWDPSRLASRPDLVIVGNAVPRSNPEVAAVEDLGLPRISMPEALARFVLRGRRPLVVAGSHGKTTTSALAAHVLARAGMDPGWLIGGVPHDLPASFALGGGAVFVLEGDEYNSAWFDRGPKFLHYRPSTLILTSAEHDHLDLYPTPESLLVQYRRLLAEMPREGLLIACADDDAVRAVLPAARARTLTYGLGAGAERRARVLADDQRGLLLGLPLPDGGECPVRLALGGEHGARNALAVWLAALDCGIEPDDAAAALAAFRGVRRRVEVVGEAAGVLVLDDFAHHPTAIATTLAGLARRFPDRRLVAVFEPRSLSSGRSAFADQYARAFDAAPVVVVAPVFHKARLGADSLDAERLAETLRGLGKTAHAVGLEEQLVPELIELVGDGDLVVTMSSGSFGNLPRRLLAALGERPEGPALGSAEGRSSHS